MKPASLVATIFIALIAIIHLLRLVLHIEVTVDGSPVPMWISMIALVFTGGLAILLYRENRRN
jgi:hypothetical protein